MTRPLSNDLRERVVAAVLGGASSREAAARFDVAVSSVVKLMQRYRTTGSVAPGKIGGHRSVFSRRIAISSKSGSNRPHTFRCML
jgi:putative transposase